MGRARRPAVVLPPSLRAPTREPGRMRCRSSASTTRSTETSLPSSTLSCADGLDTSNMHDARRFAISIALSVAAYGLFCGNERNGPALAMHRVTIAGGPMPSSLSTGFSPYMKPMLWRANPDEATTDWRAVCGRTACTVRRAGRARALSDPYQRTFCTITPFGPFPDAMAYARRCDSDTRAGTGEPWHAF